MRYHLSTLLLVPAALLAAACGSTETSAADAGGADSPGSGAAAAPEGADAAPSVYALSAESLAGEPVDLGRYRGKVTLFVNVASKCGYTRQYAGLQELSEAKGGDGFAVVGVPSNDFGGQEPGSAAQIQAFCQDTYGVTFDMLAKQGTKEGQSELFDRLAALTGERPTWNFCKYVVSADGTRARFFPSSTEPGSAELAAAIAELGG